MSVAGAFSSAASTFGDDRVDSRGELSLVRVWSRSERPLLVEATLVEGTDPINAFVNNIGANDQCFSALTNHYER